VADAAIGQSGKRSIAGLLVFDRPDITVRPITASDQAFCRALFHEDRSAGFAGLNLADGLLNTLLDQQFHAQQSAYHQAFPDADHVIIADAGVAVGQLMTAFCDSQTLHVIDILLSVSARGRGVGTDVLNSLAHAAIAKGATRLSLSVLHHNEAARRLYERLGFRGVADDGVRIAMIRQLA
jgi:ribosomal protein S18 acetylase RimI-like enzyme